MPYRFPLLPACGERSRQGDEGQNARDFRKTVPYLPTDDTIIASPFSIETQRPAWKLACRFR